MTFDPDPTATPTPAAAASSETREISPAGTKRRGSEQPGADPWRDVLLSLSLDLPLDANPRELTDRFLDGLVVLLPHLALGAVLDAVEGGLDPFAASDRRQSRLSSPAS